jgi:hypothetical protein
MINKILSKFTIFTILALLALNSCANRGDARKTSPDPTERVKDNIEQGKGISLKETFNLGKKTNFEFASSNELWRASLDTIDFMPLTSANYSGGIIITDWYSENENNSESIKLVIRFLTNEIRSDAIDLKIFYKNCSSVNNCKVSERTNALNVELKKEILKRAALYKKEAKEKKD